MLKPGLYVVATPIGHARDMTLRALDILEASHTILCENVAEVRKLLLLHGITRSGGLVSYNDHSGTPAKRARILGLISQGQVVALVSDAGTPLISDPGYKLLRQVVDAGCFLTSLPGPSACINALVLSGLPTDRFTFLGFLPPRGTKQQRALERARNLFTTLIFFEAPHRLTATLEAMIDVFGGEHPACVARELTKFFEDVQRGSLFSVWRHFQVHADTLKGEMAIVLGPPQKPAPNSLSTEALQALVQMIRSMPISQAATCAAALTGRSRGELYALLLRLKKKGQGVRDNGGF